MSDHQEDVSKAHQFSKISRRVCQHCMMCWYQPIGNKF